MRYLRERLGKEYLNSEGNRHPHDYTRELKGFFMKGIHKKPSLENIEYSFSILELICQFSVLQKFHKVINKINEYLRLSGIGYKFVESNLTPYIDGNLLESCVIPVISLLNQARFKDTYNYLHKAFESYKLGNFQDAVDNCAKSYECLLKTIFDERLINYSKKVTLMPLIAIAKTNKLLYKVADDKHNAIVNFLSSLPEIRNAYAGHGSKEKKITDSKVARLALHHVTANMLYIAENHLENPR